MKIVMCNWGQVEVGLDDGDSEEERTSWSLYRSYPVNMRFLDTFSGEMEMFRLLKLFNAVSHQKITLILGMPGV